MIWTDFFHTHRQTLEANYPGLNLQRFLREAEEIGGDGKPFLEGIPFAYQLGYAEFAGHKFKVTPDVLIPRPETEGLYELVLKNWRPSWKRLVDVCTGSGCLGISLAKARSLQPLLTDLSPAALVAAEQNAAALGIAAELREGDLLEPVVGLWDVIVCNPPYIPRSAPGVHPCTRFEPALALYVEDQAYEAFFRRLFHQAARRLSSGGMFFMEGHEDWLEVGRSWAEGEGLGDVRLETDLTQRLRYLSASASTKPIG
jgi:release factor glutamine methyltransferase